MQRNIDSFEGPARRPAAGDRSRGFGSTALPFRKPGAPGTASINAPRNQPGRGQTLAGARPGDNDGLIAVPPKAAVSLVGFYLALHTALAGEIFSVFLHIPFPVVAIFAVLVPLVVLFTGSVPAFLKTPAARSWLLLYVWMTVCSLLSFYPRESVGYVIPFSLRFGIMPFLLCGVATTSESVRKLLVWAAAGMFPILILCVTKGEMEEGYRFGISETSLSNPNDLAFHLLWGSMLMLVFLLGKSRIGKFVSVAMISSFVWFILKTASRANFFTIFAVVAVVFLLAAPSVRFVLLIGVPVVLAITLPLLPKATLNRILAVEVSSSIDDVDRQSSAAADGQLRGALGSEAARMELARLAVESTFRHPIFGVGISMFANETADFIEKTTGRKAPWQTAHNSYLKISSENGIPGFILYIWSIGAAIAMTWGTFFRSRGNPAFVEANRNSVAILLALVVYAVGTLFCDIVYLPYLCITLGLAAANYLAFRNDSRRFAASPAPAVLPPRRGGVPGIR
jgi:hypothetical protein